MEKPVIHFVGTKEGKSKSDRFDGTHKTSRVGLRCVDAGITPVHVICRAAVYPCHRPLVTSVSHRGLWASPHLSEGAELTWLEYPWFLRLRSGGHLYGKIRSNCGDIFHVVSIVEMRGRDGYHTCQRIESHPDRGTSAWQRLTS